jgi:hypothetical protein
VSAVSFRIPYPIRISAAYRPHDRFRTLRSLGCCSSSVVAACAHTLLLLIPAGEVELFLGTMDHLILLVSLLSRAGVLGSRRRSLWTAIANEYFCLYIISAF